MLRKFLVLEFPTMCVTKTTKLRTITTKLQTIRVCETIDCEDRTKDDEGKVIREGRRLVGEAVIQD